jgi:hypothetical protein
VEKQARLPAVGKLVAPWLVEGLFIAISVLLGFAAARYGENRDNRELAGRALTSLHSELDFNLSIVEPFLAFHRTHIDALAKGSAGASDESGFQLFLRLRPPLPKNARADMPLVRRAAWDAASSSGALRLIEYDLIAGLFEVYQMQDILGAASDRMPVSTQGFFDPRDRNASIGVTLAALNEILWAEESLVALYRKQLPALQAAIATR